jgi:hypothetical protein
LVQRSGISSWRMDRCKDVEISCTWFQTVMTRGPRKR